MARTTRTSEQHSTPSGAVFHQAKRGKVSETFIKSLSDDGVSRETIRSIERENARRSKS